MAWGPEGHRIVGQIAEDNLSAKAQNAIKRILAGKSLADVSNWADSVKNAPEWKHTKPWHFVDIPDGEVYESVPRDPEGDIIIAITQTVKFLKSPSTSAMDKQYALMFLVHFLGDIHQPLHVGRPDDHGGNSIKVVFDGKSTNLHALWDSGMIARQGMDYQEYAEYLQEEYSFAATYDIPEIKFSQVISEDMSLRNEIYLFHSFNFGPIILDESYMKRNLDTLNSRLLTGGKRLAFLLNKVFI